MRNDIGGFKEEHYAMTQEEVAQRMGITPGRVGQLERKALRKLRKNPEAIRHLMSIVHQPRPANAYEEAA